MRCKPRQDELDVKALGVDYLSLSAHKLHAPKGIGCLYVRQGLPYQSYIGRRTGKRSPRWHGKCCLYGRFRKSRRNGHASLGGEVERIRALRNRMEDGIPRAIPGVTRNGAKEPRLASTSNLSFADCEAEASCCYSTARVFVPAAARPAPLAPWLPAMCSLPWVCRPSTPWAAVRFSLSKYTTDAEVDYLLEKLPAIIEKLRGASPKTEQPAAEAVNS